MDRLQLCMEELRRLAKETEDPHCVILAEQAINDYLQNEIDALRAALERISKAIDDEDRKAGRLNLRLVTKMVTNEHG